VSNGQERYRAAVTFSDRLARFNRRAPNKVIRSFAGRVAPLAVVEHRGRRSGRRYRTPVMAWRIDDGYMVVLFYGADRDWVRNVLAAGGCTLERAGRQVEATRPRLLSAGAGAALVPAPVRMALRMLRVTDLLRLSTAGRAHS
jgi:deazaflavin-dependent oxidoreductase (nitroreductase family)